MIPPVLREQLIRKLTQKLVESPTFNSLVHTTQGTISAFLDGIEEGKKQKEGQDVAPTRNENERPAQQQQQQQTTCQQQNRQQQQQTYSRMHDFEKPRPTQSTSSTSSASSSSSTNGPSQSADQQQSSTSSSSNNNNASEPGLSELEAFLRRTKASIEEAERRAAEQRKK